ncbi:MAG: glycosyltransferase, partial [Patescibacteria group bacterium]
MNSSKKLIYIANLRLPTEKAYGIQIAKMCEAFADLGVDVNLVFPYRRSPFIRENIYSYYSIKNNFTTKKIWAPDFYFVGKLDEISFYIKSLISAVFLSFYALFKDVDLFYSRDEFPLFLLSFFRKNLIYEAHRFSRSRRLFYKRFQHRNLKVVVITKRLKEDLMKIGFKQENILVAPDGVDLEGFDIDMSKEVARDRIGLPLGKKIVMYAGHLFEWKGADTLLQVAKTYNLQPTTYNLFFVFVGGTEYDAEKFRQKARDMDLKNVLILGHKPHKNIPFFLKAADVLVLPNSAKEEMSKSYTSPLKMFEYMASGRPIVASDLPSLREVLNENNAVFVKPDDPESLAEGIKKIFNKAGL